MRLTFLGTSASEAYPDAFCDCANCEAVRALGGPSLRKRSLALVDEELLLDFGPDLLAAAMSLGIQLTRVRWCLLTHEHDDHLDPTNFSARHDACGPHGIPHLDFYATVGAIRLAATRLGATNPDGWFETSDVADELNATVHPVEPFETRTVGPYSVRSFLANHGSGKIVPLAFVVEHEGRSLFYCSDTGPLPDETWRALRMLPHPINVVALDHTFGFKATSSGHLNQERFLGEIERFRSEKILAADARVFAHHIGHHSNPPHPELVERAAQGGYEVAYDGLSLDV